ncbi:MAG: hypothetical protein B7C54_03955 [Acidimicrobiales bacterium mtb01]|nr:hypothetical protein [Actinomycetota bacterium]TEX46382.1 MAG: hypothetical protein B7C54_03955 [Acidimicrobiales bacterium mtb01]
MTRQIKHRTRPSKSTISTLTVLCIILASAPVHTLAGKAADQESSQLIDEIVIDRIDGRAPSTAEALKLLHIQDVEVSSIGGGFDVVGFDEPISSAEAHEVIDRLESSGYFESVTISTTRRRLAAPNDPRYPDQWYLQSTGLGIGIEQAWEITTGSPDLVIAVLDTGRLDHPDVSSRTVPGYDFVYRTRDSKDGDGWDADETDLGDWADPNDAEFACISTPSTSQSSWHGTYIAGMIAADTNNGKGIAGINQRSRIQHVRVLGTCGGRTVDEATAIRWAAGLPVPGVPTNPTPARVINMSLGSAVACESVEQSAIDAAVAAGAVIVASAGNSNFNLSITDFAPAGCNNVIAVSSVGNTGLRASYSNYGGPVDIAAPGGPSGILSASNAGTRSADLGSNGWIYSYKQGTSMAAAVVSGIVSLMLSANPSLNAEQVQAILRQTARPFPTGSGACSSDPTQTYYCGAGIVSASAAVALAAQSSSGATVTRLEQSENDDIFATNLAVEHAAERSDIILTSGSVYPDGLAAAALAKQEDADIILVPPSGLTPNQVTSILNENPQEVWIMGGPEALPTSLEIQLQSPSWLGGAGVDASRVRRVFGATRYETATAVAGRIGTIGTINGKRTAFVVRGDSFADAVIAGPATFGPADSAGAFPILLVQRDRLPDSVKTSLQGLGITNVVIVGGTSVVSDSTKRQIEALGITTYRVAGADRYGTATALANFLTAPTTIGGFGWSASNVGIVNISDESKGFDAISATGILGPTRRALIGATSSQVPVATGAWLSQLNGTIQAVTVIGSRAALPSTVIDQATILLRR